MIFSPPGILGFPIQVMLIKIKIDFDLDNPEFLLEPFLSVCLACATFYFGSFGLSCS